MIIYDLNILGICPAPAEAYTPLVIDANAPLSTSVSLQLLKPVAWRHPKCLNRRRRRQHVKLAQRYACDRCKPSVHAGLVQLLRVFALE